MEPIHHISDTALWVAMYRAEESDRPDAVFVDPYARRLAGEKGAEIAQAIDFSSRNSWLFVARTYLFDEIVQQHIAQGVDTIVNLAAGLDTRPFRMNLPANLHWWEADLPGMIHYKQAMLVNEEPRCLFQRIALDLADHQERLAFFEQVNARAQRVLVLTEGLMGYLTDEQAAELATDLSAQPTFHRWAFDLMSPAILALAQKEMGDFLKDNTELRFAPPQGELFFEPYGWKPVQSNSFIKTASALRRLHDKLEEFAAAPEPPIGPKGEFPWSGVCLLERK
jgi:methyltransferase (TIGR00027 family)